MDFSRNLSVLVAGVFLLTSGIGGQNYGDFMKICDFCHEDGLLDCSLAQMVQVNMTVNCKLPGKMCTLGIDQSFDDFDNLTMQDINMEWMCLLKDDSVASATFTVTNSTVPINTQRTEGFEHLKTTTEGTFVTDPNISKITEQITESFDHLKTSTEGTLVTNLKVPLITGQTRSLDHFKTTTEGTSVTSPMIPTITERTEGFEHLKYTTEGESVTSPTTPTMIGRTEGVEYYKTATEGTFVESSTILDSIDYQGDQPTEIIRTFRSDPGPDSANQQPPTDEMITCFVCNSISDEACLGKVEKLKTSECPKATGCLTMYFNAHIVRGCGSSIHPKEVELCHKPGNTTCDCCPDPKCNKISWQQCHQCNSKDDPNCALWTNVKNVPVATCPNYDDKCLVLITKDGDTVRECTRANSKCPEGESCFICDGPLCNFGVFPANRTRCIQCQECDDAQDPASALPCVQYNPNEECFLYVTAKSKMIRDCVSNANEMQQCRMNAPKCITCTGSNGCNSAPLMKDASLSCSKCNSKDNPSCAWAQPLSSVAKCERKVLYYLQETCMMEFNSATQAAVRDCSFDYGVCIPEDQNCRTCSGDGCNRGNLKVQQCIQCSSEQPGQSKCSSRAEGIPPTNCPQETQTYQTKGCYAMTKDNITTRGCTAGLSEDEFKLCTTEGNSHCDPCVEDGCNNLLAPSRGLRTGQISLFAVIGAILINV